MPQITVLYWNIEVFGAAKYGPEIIAFIAETIESNQADVVCMNELRGGFATVVGFYLQNQLRNTGRAANWQSQPSPVYSTNNEEYLFLWRTGAVTATGFQGTYLDAQGNAIGFPNGPQTNRPPYLGYFQTVAMPQRNILIAGFHAPRPAFWPDVRNGNRRLASVTEFANQGHICLIMGDTNIGFNNDVAVNNSNGQQPWASVGFNLAGGGGRFTQLLPNEYTSLIDRNQAWNTMTVGNCYSETYDQMFIRHNPATGNTAAANATSVELISECMTNNYLELYLDAIETAWTGISPGGYATVADAFVAYRRYVSDHIPVIVDITW